MRQSRYHPTERDALKMVGGCSTPGTLLFTSSVEQRGSNISQPMDRSNHDVGIGELKRASPRAESIQRPSALNTRLGHGKVAFSRVPFTKQLP